MGKNKGYLVNYDCDDVKFPGNGGCPKFWKRWTLKRQVFTKKGKFIDDYLISISCKGNFFQTFAPKMVIFFFSYKINILMKCNIYIIDPGFVPSDIPLGEACGSCFCPPNYTAGNCAKGLNCMHDPRIADAPGRCVKPQV